MRDRPYILWVGQCLGGRAAWMGSDVTGFLDKLLLGLGMVYFEHSFIHLFNQCLLSIHCLCAGLGVRDTMSNNTESWSHPPGVCCLLGKPTAWEDRGYSALLEKALILSSLFFFFPRSWEKNPDWSTWFYKQVVLQQQQPKSYLISQWKVSVCDGQLFPFSKGLIFSCGDPKCLLLWATPSACNPAG